MSNPQEATTGQHPVNDGTAPGATPAPVTDRARNQFYSACRCYRQRAERISTGKTWAEWFAEKWGETLTDYFARIRAAKFVNDLVDYEFKMYGASAAREVADKTIELLRQDRFDEMIKRGRGRK